ncbi:photosynthetic NDH subunit of lumenal location 3, chloroplastic [Asparagus officinalis]|uniref:photosynthetic NDH subunit of lumenal location 3, chloroplastic n=1 Tax=Asparagus officinalis TaxID=4686 RepID=UPI00098E43D6|nr:photosynthetic NDH subunit of lumenal location 3, chloroplastic [Asparagus officinalis]
MATPLSNLNAPTQLFSSSPKSKPKFITSAAKTSQIPQLPQINTRATSRRATLSLATVAAIFNQLLPLHAEEENNGFWLTGPLPVPTVTNKIANEESGTRSFLKKGIYMANIGVRGSMLRLKHYAFDLLALGDLIGQDNWNYLKKYLCLKSTVMYYDFDKVISAAPADQKQPLLQLANRLFDNVEKLEDAVKQKSDPLTRSCYHDTTVVLQEVMARMA